MENIPISYLGSNTSDNQNALIKLCFCGLWHSVIVFQDTDDVYAWGWNKFNQVGRGVGESSF